jgi:hypothetical protein
MLLYLSSSGKSGITDFLEEENEQAQCNKPEVVIKKLVGRFTLKQFVVKDMRNYQGYKHFMVDIGCIDDSLDDFIVALQSFQMMFNARIIVILSGCDNEKAYTEKLIGIGVTDIVTANTAEDIQSEIKECLSEGGMQRYKQIEKLSKQELKIVPPGINESVEIEIPRYKWSAKNIKIAVAGADRRSGVTVTAFNFANWLIARGATACYVEMNMNRHLHYLIERYTYEKEGEHYPVGDVDCFLTNEIDKDYNFIIYDCGAIKELTNVFKEADIRLICGSLLPYEETNYSRLLHLCKNLSIFKIALSVPLEFQSDCKATFGEGLMIADASHDLFNDNINGHIYHPIVKEYIIPERKL